MGGGHQERDEPGCVLPWNITYFASSERGFLKISQALGAEKVEVALWSSRKNRGPDRQTDSVCAQQRGSRKAEREETGRDRMQPGGTPRVRGSGRDERTLGASQGRSGAAWSSSKMICLHLETPSSSTCGTFPGPSKHNPSSRDVSRERRLCQNHKANKR